MSFYSDSSRHIDGLSYILLNSVIHCDSIIDPAVLLENLWEIYMLKKSDVEIPLVFL